MSLCDLCLSTLVVAVVDVAVVDAAATVLATVGEAEQLLSPGYLRRRSFCPRLQTILEGADSVELAMSIGARFLPLCAACGLAKTLPPLKRRRRGLGRASSWIE